MTQRYLFAHVLLPGLFWSDRETFRRILQGMNGTAFLNKLWTHAGQHVAQVDYRLLQPPTGLRLEGASPDLSVVVLPAPVEVPDAYFVGLRWDVPACTTLEMGEEGETYLCGWDKQKHVNYGPGPIPEVAAFLEALRKPV